MLVIGLTGSIGMGKSTTANMLRRMRIPVHDADATVHKLMAKGGAAIPALQIAFPEAILDGAVDRQKLGAIVFADPTALKRLEAIIHPLVSKRTEAFLQSCRLRRVRFAVLDVPLLFEGSGHKRCNKIIVVSAPAFLQRRRVLSRPGMSVEKFRSILAKQMPDIDKRRRADIVVPTGLGEAFALRRLKRSLKHLT